MVNVKFPEMVHSIDVWDEVTLLGNLVRSNVAYAVVYSWKDVQVLGNHLHKVAHFGPHLMRVMLARTENSSNLHVAN